MSKKVKEEELFTELEGKSGEDVAEIVNGHIANKEYKAKQMKEVLNEYSDDLSVFKAAHSGLTSLINLAEMITEKQEKAYEEAVKGFNAVMSDPNASEELRSKAIDASVECYKSLTNVVYVVWTAIIGTAAVAFSYFLFRRNGKNEKK